MKRLALLLILTITVLLAVASYLVLGPELLSCWIVGYQDHPCSGIYQSLQVSAETILLKSDGSFIGTETDYRKGSVSTWGWYRLHQSSLYLHPVFRTYNRANRPRTKIFHFLEDFQPLPVEDLRRPVARFFLFTCDGVECLLEDRDVIHLANVLNAGSSSQSRRPSFGLYTKDGRAPSLERKNMILPDSVTRLILTKPVIGRVTALPCANMVVIAVDRPDLLRFGSLLYCWSPQANEAAKVMITDVVGMQVFAYFSSFRHARPSVGQIVSTQVPDIPGWHTVASHWED